MGDGLSNSSKSIHDLAPLETGGVEARQGFGLQDHVAAGFCIEMLKNPQLTQVWCESQDDITLIWGDGEAERVEFVQVKSNEPDQLWSVAMLCQRESKAKSTNGTGTSILEKSLAYDRCKEPCCFRIVTSRPVKDELKILTYALDSAHRTSSPDAVTALADHVATNVGDFRSPNDRCCKFWVSSATWDEMHSTESVREKNVLEFLRIVRGWDSVLFVDQVGCMYDKLLFKVQEAALARHADDPGAKKLLRHLVIAWVKEEVARAEHPVAPGTGTALKVKMQQAGIADDVIDNAIEHRQQYRIDVLTPQYQELGNRRKLDRSVAGELHLLLSRFDAGQLGNSGVEFHALCLEKVSELAITLTIFPKPGMALLFGCMYNITDRCGHRFRRPTG